MVRKAGLDRSTVIAAAADLADEGGLDNITLGALAARLGVRTPSLYNHVDGLEGLRCGLALYGTRELNARLLRAVACKSADDALVAVANAYRDYVKAHPGLYAAMAPAANPTDRELSEAQREVVAILLAVLASYGLVGDDALHQLRGLRSVVHGFATLEMVGGFGLPLDCDESFRRVVQMVLAGIHAAVP